MALKDIYYTISEAGKELNVSRQTIYRWIADNKIPTEKIGGVILVEKIVINEYAVKKATTAMMSMFDGLAFETLRQNLSLTDKDLVERDENEGDQLVFIVTHKNGGREKVSVGYSELTVAGSTKSNKMNLKFDDIKRQALNQPKKGSKSTRKK